MSSDGGLRLEFKKHLPDGDWVAVETGGTASGVPDANYCFEGGAEGWVECKRTLGWAVKIRPGQVGWISRRRRRGGRVFVAVRRMCGDADELWLIDGDQVRELSEHGLRGVKSLGVWRGGPRRWDWAQVRSILSYGKDPIFT